MRDRKCAVAWEDFNGNFKFQKHIKNVENGNIILLFANGVGIIAVGRAKGSVKILEPTDPDRIRDFPGETNTPEWRVPVEWLEWRDDEKAYKWKADRFTFWDVSDLAKVRYRELREGVIRTFCPNAASPGHAYNQEGGS